MRRRRTRRWGGCDMPISRADKRDFLPQTQNRLERTFRMEWQGKLYPQHMVWVPPTYITDISATVGGFYVGKYQASQPNASSFDDNPDVGDSAAVGTTPAATQFGVPAWRYITLLEARKAAANVGQYIIGTEADKKGWGLSTAADWAALAFIAKGGTMPGGNNANTNPPSDTVTATQKALLDHACNTRSSGWYACLTGTGPTAWSHDGTVNGVWDLNGNMWEWNDGLLMQITTGYPYILANLDNTIARAPVGKSTAVAAGTLTDTDKAWVADAFLDAGGTIYLYDSAGTLHQLATSTPANNDTTLYLAATGTTPASGPYTIVKLIATDITAGMSSGNKILTLRDADADLKHLAIPATSDGTGAAAYGNDGFWFNTGALRAALRGGSWDNGADAGVFALGLNNAPSRSIPSIGFRLRKAL